MTAETPRPQGTLDVSFKSSSVFLGDNLPVEVRDAASRLVTRSTGRFRQQLDAGLYVVEATVPGGMRLSEVVQVKAGEETLVVLQTRKPGRAAGQGATEAGEPERDEERDEEREEGEARNLVAAEDDLPAIELLDQVDCTLLEGAGSRWVFDAVPAPSGTPTARFRAGGTVITVSIPAYPSAKAEERPCTVTFRRVGGRVRADVGFARQRRVAWTLEGLVKSGDSVSTAELFRNADHVLFEKYRDPIAAALGGLTLHRLGRLRERPWWVENLARDFSWIPDGRVLLAALLERERDERARMRGLDALVGSAVLRPVFADGRALALKLLRSWPDDDRGDARRQALRAIAAEPGSVDWDAMAFTTYDET